MDELFRKTEQTEGYRLTVDLETQTVTDGTGLKIPFQVDPFRRDCLHNGWDDIGLTLRHEDRITAFEKQHKPRAVAYEGASGSQK